MRSKEEIEQELAELEKEEEGLKDIHVSMPPKKSTPATIIIQQDIKSVQKDKPLDYKAFWQAILAQRKHGTPVSVTLAKYSYTCKDFDYVE